MFSQIVVIPKKKDTEELNRKKSVRDNCLEFIK